MTTAIEAKVTTQVYRVFIKATPQAIWDAITRPEWTQRADPPRKLVQTWRALWAPELVAEGHRRVTWEIAEAGPGITALTVTHELDGAPKTAAQVAGTTDLASGGGGWSWILSDLKTLLETGKSLES